MLALIGDGAAQFTFMELAAAVQEQLPIIILLWNNDGYREIKTGMLASGVAPVGVDIAPPDFLAAAQALGCTAERIDSLAQLESRLPELAASKIPALLELPESAFLTTPAGDWY